VIIKSRYRPAIRRGIRIVLTAFVLSAVSMIVFFRDHVFLYTAGLSGDDIFIVVAYSLILFGYAVFISELYGYWYRDGGKGNPHLWFSAYVLLAVLVVVSVNTLFIQVLVKSEVPNLLRYRPYWQREFPFFLVPLLLYTLMVHRVAACRILLRGGSVRDLRASAQWTLWLSSHEPSFLLAYLRSRHGSSASQGRPIRPMDIVAMLYEQGSYFLLLSDGEKLLTGLTPKDLAGWSMGGWFVRVQRSRYLNMLYFEPEAALSNEVRLNATAKKGLSVQNRERIEIGGGVNRRCQKHVHVFWEAYKDWPVEGWEEPVDCWPEQRK